MRPLPRPIKHILSNRYARHTHTSARGSLDAALRALSWPLKSPERAASSRRGVHTTMFVTIAPISSQAMLSHHILALTKGAAQQQRGSQHAQGILLTIIDPIAMNRAKVKNAEESSRDKVQVASSEP